MPFAYGVKENENVEEKFNRGEIGDGLRKDFNESQVIILWKGINDMRKRVMKREEKVVLLERIENIVELIKNNWRKEVLVVTIPEGMIPNKEITEQIRQMNENIRNIFDRSEIIDLDEILRWKEKKEIYVQNEPNILHFNDEI